MLRQGGLANRGNMWKWPTINLANIVLQIRLDYYQFKGLHKRN